MKKVIILAFALLTKAFSYASADSSKIYITKNSFINNQADYSSDYRVKKKNIGWGGQGFSFFKLKVCLD